MNDITTAQFLGAMVIVFWGAALGCILAAIIERIESKRKRD